MMNKAELKGEKHVGGRSWDAVRQQCERASMEKGRGWEMRVPGEGEEGGKVFATHAQSCRVLCA